MFRDTPPHTVVAWNITIALSFVRKVTMRPLTGNTDLLLLSFAFCTHCTACVSRPRSRVGRCDAGLLRIHGRRSLQLPRIPCAFLALLRNIARHRQLCEPNCWDVRRDGRGRRDVFAGTGPAAASAALNGITGPVSVGDKVRGTITQDCEVRYKLIALD